MKKFIFFILNFGMIFNLISYSQVPNKISYQGLLTTSSGTPIQDGDYDLQFALFDVSTGGTSLWTESHSAIKVTKGTFSVILGSVSSIGLAFDRLYYLEVKAVAGPGITTPITFSPRSELTSSPYSLSSWNLTGNAGTTPGTNFVGTTDAQPLDIRTNNLLKARITTKGQIETYNTGRSVFVGEGAGANDDLSDNDNVFVGYQTGFSNTTGYRNTTIGKNGLYSNTIGIGNTASGYEALYSNTTGNTNTANGAWSLYSNTTGNTNTASGYGALISNTVGSCNTAYGVGAMYYNVAGSNATAIGYGAMRYTDNSTTPFTCYNVAVGFEALSGSTNPANNTGNYNTAIGYQTLLFNTTGSSNTANGMWSLRSNTTGNQNTASGYQALYYNTTGNQNVASGCQALYTNTTGNTNTASGYQALRSNTTGNQNTAKGSYALYYNTTESNNTAVGHSAGDFYTFSNGTFLGADANPNVSGYTNVMGLGYQARPTGSNRVHIGNTSITWIGGQVSWSTYSDARYKRNIREDVKGLDFIMRLRPVTYNVAANEMATFLKEDQKRDKDGNIVVETNELDRKSREEKERIRYTGFIAQEVEQAAREVGFEFSGIDIPKDENGLYSLRYAEFVVPLVKAVQELKRENDELKKRIEELEKR